MEHGGTYSGPAVSFAGAFSILEVIAIARTLEAPYNLLKVPLIRAHTPGVGRIAASRSIFHAVNPAFWD